MSQLSKSNFEALYSAPSGTFPDNTTGAISEGDMRQFAQDIADSFPNKDTDALTGVKGTAPGIDTIAELKALVTVGVGTTSIPTITFRDTGNSDVLRVYMLVSGTDAESSPNVIRPDDYNGTTNQKVWKLAQIPSGGGTVESVTGDGVNNTDPDNPVLTFPVASDVDFTPAGAIAATNVQAALQELDNEKQAALGFTPENQANKKTDLSSPNNTDYPTTQAVSTGITSAVTSALEGLRWKEPVRAISTSNITLSGAQTIDGVSIVAGNRVLVAGQTSATDNGIYVAAAGTWSRSSDANSASELEGATVTVQEGTTNANTTWTQTTDGITLGSSNIVWSQFGSSVPNASTSVAGKVEIATTAEAKAGTTAGGTGADLAIRPDVLREKLRANRTVTGADSIVQGDSEGLIYFNSASAFNFTIDQLVIDSYTSFINIGAGTVTFVNGTGVTISGATTLKQGQSGAIFYRSATAPLITVSAEVVGLEDLYVPASSMYPRTSNGCAAVAQSEIATSLVNILTLDFDQTTQEFAQFTISLPRNWNNGTVTAKFYWTATSGTATNTVVWAISGGAYSDDDALTAALGTAQTVTDAYIAANDMHISSATAAITLAGSPADADFLAFQIARNAGDDSLAADAKLIGIVLTLTTDSSVAG